MQRASIETLDGLFRVSFSDTGLARLDFPSNSSKPLSEPEDGPWRAWLDLTRRALQAALSGMRVPELPPLDLSVGSGFQREVWGILGRIKPGCTMTYQQVAMALHKPGAARAVGSACGANPVPVLIPCHRVIATGGGLGGFSGGLDWKRKLLDRERKPTGWF